MEVLVVEGSGSRFCSVEMETWFVQDCSTRRAGEHVSFNSSNSDPSNKVHSNSNRVKSSNISNSNNDSNV